MAFTPLRLAAAQLTTSAATYYTAPVDTKAIVKQIILSNTTGTAATASISLVASGGTASASNRIVEQISVPANGVVMLDLSQVLEAGDFLAALAGTASAINMRVSGMEYA